MNDETALISTEIELRNFLGSHVWLDLSNEMQKWLGDIHEQLETQPDISMLHKLQGNAEAVHRFLDLPKVLVEILEVQNSFRRPR